MQLLSYLLSYSYNPKNTTCLNRKVQVSNDQDMAQSERYSHSIDRGVGKNDTVGNDQEMAQLERHPHSINRGLGKKTKITKS